MTALAIVYTSAGLVFAADGRARLRNDKATSKVATFQADTDSQQKIFKVEDEGRILAYSMSGKIANKDRSFYMVTEAAKQARLLAKRRFDDGYDYVRRFCRNLHEAASEAKRDGRIEKFPDDGSNYWVTMIFGGYFHKTAFCVTAEFIRENDTRVRLKTTSIEIPPGRYLTIGPPILTRLMFKENDPRFAKYKKPVDENVTLEGAADFGKTFIEASADRLALQLDPDCEGVGGHIHIAAITPADGFKWLIPPVSQNPVTVP